jgi:hypothetical protein
VPDLVVDQLGRALVATEELADDLAAHGTFTGLRVLGITRDPSHASGAREVRARPRRGERTELRAFDRSAVVAGSAIESMLDSILWSLLDLSILGDDWSPLGL